MTRCCGVRRDGYCPNGTRRDASFPSGGPSTCRPWTGKGLVLTIDAAIQAAAERELDRACIATLSEYCADPVDGPAQRVTFWPWRCIPASIRTSRGTIPPRCGAIGSSPTSSSRARRSKSSPPRPRWRKASSTPDERFFDAGYIEIGGGRVHCWRGGGHGSLTFAEAVEHSCNPVFAELGGLRLGSGTVLSVLAGVRLRQSPRHRLPGRGAGHRAGAGPAGPRRNFAVGQRRASAKASRSARCSC